MKIPASELISPPSWSSRDQIGAILNSLELFADALEIGVQRGINACTIRSTWKGSRLHCVDPWRPYYGVRDTAEMHEQYMKDAVMHLEATGKPFEIHRMTATEFAEYAKEQRMIFDFIYLDGDHAEEPLRNEIELFWPMVAHGGILAGHDYQPNGWIRDEQPTIAYATEEEAGIGQHCGPFFVKKVVDETFPEGMVSITSPDEDRGWRSWMVRKK